MRSLPEWHAEFRRRNPLRLRVTPRRRFPIDVNAAIEAWGLAWPIIAFGVALGYAFTKFVY